MLNAQFFTDTGQHREKNEDAGGIFYNQTHQQLLVLCDGMGGHKAGEVASQFVTNQLRDYFETENFIELDQAESWLSKTLKDIKVDMEGKGYTIKQSNPEIFTDAVKESIRKSNRTLEVYKGEAKSAALGRIHAGITSTRMDIKSEMKKYESLLPLVVEPRSIISKTIGGKYDQDISNYYWKTIFKNQFHDSIY